MFASIQLVRDDGPGGTGEVRRILDVLARLRPSGIAWGIDYTLSPSDVLIEETLNEEWVLDEPVQMRIEVHDMHPIVATHGSTNTFRNMYVVHNRNGAALDIACGSQYDRVNIGVAHNDTVLQYSHENTVIGVEYNVKVHISQGLSTKRTVQLTHRAMSGAVPGASASVEFVHVDIAFAHASVAYGIMHDPSRTDDPYGGTYFVPVDLPGRMSKNVFMREFSCPDPFDAAAAIRAAQDVVRPTPDSSPYDQLSAYRSTAAQEAMVRPLGCTRCGQTDSSIALCCTDNSILEIRIQLDAVDTFHLVRLFGQPHITDSGVLPLSPGDTSIIIFVDVANRGTIEGIFEVRPTLCCITRDGSSGTREYDCDALEIGHGAIRLPVTPGQSARARFYATAELVIGVDGYCDFDLLQHGNVELTHRVSFDTAMDEYIQALAEFEKIGVGPRGPECTPPATLVVSFGRELCQSPCTADQVVDAGICRPVDCVSKYAGSRNIYNVQTDMCEPTAVCDPEREDFDAPTNRCVVKRAEEDEEDEEDEDEDEDEDAAASPEPPPPPSSVPDPGWDDESPFADVPPEGLAPPSAMCGPHGSPSADGLRCECNPGWTNVPPAGETADSLECLFLDNGDYTQTPERNMQQASGGASQSIMAYAVLALILLCCCALPACCILHRRRRRRREAERNGIEMDGLADDDDDDYNYNSDDDEAAFLDDDDNAFAVDDWSDDDAWAVTSGDAPGGIPARPADIAASRVSLRTLSKHSHAG